MEITATINDISSFVESLNEWDARDILYEIFNSLSAEKTQITLIDHVGIPRVREVLGWDEDKLLDCIPQDIIASYLRQKGYEVKKHNERKG